MKAIGYQQPGDSLQDITLPQPTAAGQDLLVEVKAISVNPVDTKVHGRAGAEAAEQWKVLGWDASGVVKAVGDQVSRFKPGDEIWYAGALNRQGSNAELQLVDERIAAQKPASLSFAEAAALPLTAVTAWEMLFDRLQLEREVSQRVLVIGAAGGVGSVMTQLLKQLTQMTVIGTASRPESKQWLEQLGADHVINHSPANDLSLSEQLQQLGMETVDYVICLTNSDQHQQQIAEVIAPQGKFGLIDDPAELDIRLFKQKSVSIHWEFMYTRSLFETEDMAEQHRILSDVSRMVDSGELKTTVTSHYGTINADNLKRAHQTLKSQTAIGKIVLEGF